MTHHRNQAPLGPTGVRPMAAAGLRRSAHQMEGHV